MKLLRIPVFGLLLLLVLAGNSFGQCGPTKSPTDSVYTVSVTGAQGDTINVPIYVLNDTTIASFQIYLEYDSSLIKPVWVADTVFVDSNSVPTDTLIFYDFTQTARVTTSPEFTLQVINDLDFPVPDSANWDRIKVLGLAGLPGLGDPVAVAVASGAGVIMNVPFVINPGAPQNSQTTINDYVEPIFIIDSLGGIIEVGCQYAKYTDTSGLLDIRFRTGSGTVTFDSNFVAAPVPVINSFTASPGSILSGQSSSLSWSVTGADSVFISPLSIWFQPAVTSTSVSPTSSTNYLLTARNSGGDATASATVTVTQPGGNTPPTISLSPATTTYVVDQGQTVSFSVTATDSITDNITLTANSLSANMTFSPSNPVLGTGSVTGTFSFTPDITQSGAFSASFTAVDNGGLSSNTAVVNITVNALQFDVIQTTSADGQQPVGGLKAATGIYFPVNLVSTQTVYGIQFDLLYDANYFTVDSFVTTGRTAGYTIYDNLGQTSGRVRVVTFGLANEPIVTVADTTAIVYAVMSVDPSALPGDYPVTIDSGWESVNPDPEFPSLELVTQSGIVQVDNLGDVNLDKRVDVADLVNIVSRIIGTYSLSFRQSATADVIANDTINVFDLVGVVNLVFGLPINPAPGAALFPDWATVSLDYDDLLVGSSDVMTVRSELPTEVAGVELTVAYNASAVRLGQPRLAADADHMILSHRDNGQGQMKILMHFKNPFRDDAMIHSGLADLIEIPVTALRTVQSGDRSKIRLTQALLSTESAASVAVEGFGGRVLPQSFALNQNYPNPFNPSTTVEFVLGSDDGSLNDRDVTLEVFNILGQSVKTLVDEPLSPGLYQYEWTGSDSHGRQVATGIYLYRLRVGNDIQTKKMLLLK
ncbi:MAG: cohesin domain-containing protein [Candidatus Zixiibacteriota bacterium]